MESHNILTAMELREKILESLARTGQTRAELIRLTGIDRDSVYRYLAGKQDIGSRSAGKLLEAAGCTITLPRWRKGRG